MLPRAKKSYGQNWLIDETVVGKIVQAAEIVPGERVLEIGPGTGVLTQALVDAGARVTAVEADASLIPALRARFGDAIELVHGDILSFELDVQFLNFKLVSNIPYNISSAVLRRFLTAPPAEPDQALPGKPSRMVLMVQREVADRITAAPPLREPGSTEVATRSEGSSEPRTADMSLLSVVCQLYAQCQRVCIVPAGAFRPVPKVDSAVVRLDLIDAQARWGIDPEAVAKLAKLGFSSRRKQLHRNLSSIASPQDTKAALARLGLPLTARAQELGVEQWVTLARIFAPPPLPTYPHHRPYFNKPTG